MADANQEIDRLLEILDAQEKLRSLNMADRGRLIAAGASLNWGDEWIAAVRAATTDETYEEALAAEREALKSARGKEGSLKYELGGALVPAIAAAPFTGGGSVPVTMGRVATIGAGEGLASSLGESEGEGLMGRLTEDPLKIGLTTVGGAVLGPLSQKVVTGVSNAINKGLIQPASKTSRSIRGKLAKPVEDDLIRIINEGNLTIDEVLTRIKDGEIIPDMSQQTANAVRAVYAKGGEGAQIIGDALTRRADELPKEAREFILSKLAPAVAPDENILKYVAKTADQLEDDASNAYKKVFSDYAGLGSEEINNAVLDAMSKIPRVKNAINKVLKAEGLENFFELAEDGTLRLTRDIDLETAENVRRVVKDQVTRAYKAGEGRIGEAYNSVEKSLRTAIDDFAPDLGDTREFWAKIKQAADFYEGGTKIFGMQGGSDAAQLLFERVVQAGDQEFMDAFRAGIASALKKKYEAAGGMTRMTNALANLDASDRKIIEYIFPSGSIDEALKKVDLAAGSIGTKSKVVGGSQTAITEQNVKRIGTANNLANIAEFISSGGTNIFALGRTIKNVFQNNKKVEGLTDDELKSLAELLISENKDLLEKALTDTAARQQLAQSVASLVDKVKATAGGVAAIEGAPAVGDIFSVSEAQAQEDDEDEGIKLKTIQELAAGINKNSRQKIIESAIGP